MQAMAPPATSTLSDAERVGAGPAGARQTGDATADEIDLGTCNRVRRETVGSWR